jgi:hypothetical protein
MALQPSHCETPLGGLAITHPNIGYEKKLILFKINNFYSKTHYRR